MVFLGIGSRYLENRETLIQRIKARSVVVEDDSDIRARYYFCRNKIEEGIKKRLTFYHVVNGARMETKYWAHSDCYEFVSKR